MNQKKDAEMDEKAAQEERHSAIKSSEDDRVSNKMFSREAPSSPCTAPSSPMYRPFLPHAPYSISMRGTVMYSVPRRNCSNNNGSVPKNQNPSHPPRRNRHPKQCHLCPFLLPFPRCVPQTLQHQVVSTDSRRGGDRWNLLLWREWKFGENSQIG